MVEFIPVSLSHVQDIKIASTLVIQTLRKQPPPTKYFAQEDGRDVYMWFITEDEYLRLNKLFGREFQETGLGGTRVIGLPKSCDGCGKYTEFIDWYISNYTNPFGLLLTSVPFGRVWTALHRGVHSREFMFKALKESRQGMEPSHDVYCSECGMLTQCRSRNNAEGGAADIFLAGVSLTWSMLITPYLT